MNTELYSTLHFPSMTPVRATGERALVLGGGGSAGNAWVIGVVAGLFEAGLDVMQADLVIGTSAGSTAAAQITGTSPSELFAAIVDAPLQQRPAAGGGAVERGAERLVVDQVRPAQPARHDQDVDRTVDRVQARVDADAHSRARDDVTPVERGDHDAIGVAGGREHLGGPGDVEDLATLVDQHDDAPRPHGAQAIAGASGCFYASFVGTLVPDSFFVTESFNMLAMAIVGGLGTMIGPVIGAVVLTVLPELLRGIGDLRLVVYGVALTLVVLLVPGGLVEGWAVLRARLFPRAPSPEAAE